MREKTIGNYTYEDAEEVGFLLLHNERHEYLSDQEGNRMVVKDAGRYSAVSGTFAVELLSGGFMLVGDSGLCRPEVFAEIGYECSTGECHRPVKFSGEDNVWTYSLQTESGTELMYEDLCRGTREGEEIRLGDKLGDGIYYCIEHYPHGKRTSYKTIAYVYSGTEGTEITNFHFSSFFVVSGKKECIVGKALEGKTVVFGPHYRRALVTIFDRLMSYSPDGKYWMGKMGNQLVAWDIPKQKRYKKDSWTNPDSVVYNPELKVFLLYTAASVPLLYDIWDMEWQAAGIHDYKLWKKMFPKSRNTLRVVDYLGQSYDLTIKEFVARNREMLDALDKQKDKVLSDQVAMMKSINKELDELGFNALRSFCKTTSFSKWTAYFFRTTIKQHHFTLRTIIISTPLTKIETSALVIVEPENKNKLYVCQRLKEDVDNHVFFLSILFELEDFPKDLLKDIPSGAKIKVADLLSAERDKHLAQLQGKNKPAHIEEKPKESVLLILMQQLCERDKEKQFPATEVEFDGTKYSLTPHQPWGIAEDPFYKNSFLPKDNGVYVLLNDNFVNEPLRAFVTTEGAFSIIPDYTIEGVGKDGQYIANGNANGHIILKRKDVLLFYRDKDGNIHFFDRATYWGHSEHGTPTRPILHIYLRSLLRKA